MQRIVYKIIEYCVNQEIISSKDIPWFQYNLEKAISTILVGIPFFIIGFAISSIPCAISFFITYFYVRKYIGGYHAKTVQGCVAFSLLTELVFLGVLPHLLNTPVSLGVLGISIFTVLKLAPYNHPNMHLSPEEILICKKSARIRIYVATLVNVIAYLAEARDIAEGCTASIAMAAALLCLGYIHDWRNIHHEQQHQKGCKTDCHKSDIEWPL